MGENNNSFKLVQAGLIELEADLNKKIDTISGIATGFTNIDKLTDGFHENELIVIASRPAMGKTTLALNMAVNMSLNGKRVALFSMEMSVKQISMKIISSVGQIDINKLKSGCLDRNDWLKLDETISILSSSRIYINDTPGITISEIRKKCMDFSLLDKGFDVIIIDYLQLISSSSSNFTKRKEELSEIVCLLKTLAMELKIPIIVLSTLPFKKNTRKEKIPSISDLGEYDYINQYADIVAFLYDESIDEDISLCDFIVVKHRIGPLKTIKLVFKKKNSLFFNYYEEE